MEIAKHPKYAERKILGKPPTSLKITTETGQELDWSELLTYMSEHDVKDTSVRYILFTTGDSYLKIEYYHPERAPSRVNKNTTVSMRFNGKYIFKKDASTPEEIQEFEDMFLIHFDVTLSPPDKYIDKIFKIAAENDIKLGLRELDFVNSHGTYYKKPYIPKSSTTIQFSITPITNPLNGKTTNVPVAIIPKGTYLYRGVSLGYGDYLSRAACFLVTPEYYDKLPVVFFTLDPNIALGYADNTKRGCIEIFTPKEDIQLIDFWTKEVLENFIDINLFENSKSITLGGETLLSESVTGTQKSHVQTLFGTNRKSDVDFLNDKPKTSNYTKVFKDGSFQTDSSGKNTGFLYRGLTWGPDEGQYKRKSINQIDFYAFEQLFTQFPTDINGFYCVAVPADGGGNFHSEVIIPSSVFKTKFELVGRKQLGDYVGSRRTKKRRTYKKKVKKTKKRTIRYL
jgi:hypothetical protein